MTTEFGANELERVWADSLSPTPESVVIDRPDWVQLRTPSHPEPNLNCVVLARLDPDQADARIAEVVQVYREQGLPLRWVVGPSSTPGDLSARLVRAGVPVSAAALGMHMPVPDEVPALPEGLELRRVGHDDIVRYAEVTMRAWQRGPDFRRTIEASTRRIVASAQPRHHLWLVERGGEAIGSSVLCLLPGVGYFQGAAIVPEQRSKGIYPALIHHRLAVLRELGVEHALVWAHESTSAGICRRVGFVSLCRAVIHELLVGP